jgi:hypothetical protein
MQIPVQLFTRTPNRRMWLAVDVSLAVEGWGAKGVWLAGAAA